MSEEKVGSLDHIKPSEVDYDLRHIRDEEMMAPIEEVYFEGNYVKDVLRTEKRPEFAVRTRLEDANVVGLLTLLTGSMERHMVTADKLKRHIFYGADMGQKSDIESRRIECEVTEQKLRLFHCALGLLTESHELFTKLMYHFLRNDELDVVNFREELGDHLWYIGIGADATGDHDLSRLMQTNIRKLKARFPEKFTDAEALNRDLESERKILEAHKPKFYDCFWMDHESQISYMVRFREYGLSGIEVVSMKSGMDHGGNEVDLSAKWFKVRAAAINRACIEALPNKHTSTCKWFDDEEVVNYTIRYKPCGETGAVIEDMTSDDGTGNFLVDLQSVWFLNRAAELNAVCVKDLAERRRLKGVINADA